MKEEDVTYHILALQTDVMDINTRLLKINKALENISELENISGKLNVLWSDYTEAEPDDDEYEDE